MDPPSAKRPDPSKMSRSPRPAPARDTVEIPRVWLAVLAGGLAVALLLVAYLVGRESGRRADGAVGVDPPAAASMETAPPEYTDDDDGEWDDEQPLSENPGEGYLDAGGGLAAWPPADGSIDTEPQPSRWPDVAEAPRQSDPQAAAVAAYFSEIEALEQQAKYWSNPQELAMSLVGQGAQGDTSGMRQLLETQRAAQSQIEAMTVPSSCQEHHRRTVQVLGKALRLLEKLESGMASGNLDSLLSLSGEARTLEADTRKVDALGAELKREYGLAG